MGTQNRANPALGASRRVANQTSEGKLGRPLSFRGAAKKKGGKLEKKRITKGSAMRESLWVDTWNDAVGDDLIPAA